MPRSAQAPEPPPGAQKACLSLRGPYLHIVASDMDDAREQFVLALERDRADRGLAAATQAAREAVAGLAADGPVRVVATERARLAAQIEHADQQAARWQRAATALERQARQHHAESGKQRAIITAAETTADRVRAEVAAPLVAQATHDASTYLAAREHMWQASQTYRLARGLRKRGSARNLATATDERGETEAAVLRRWGSLPQTTQGAQRWADTVAHQQADLDPRVTEAYDRLDDARQDRQRLVAWQANERADLRRQIASDQPVTSAPAQAARWRACGEAARRDLAAIEALPIAEAAQLIHDRADRAAAPRIAAEAASHAPAAAHRPDPERGFGPSL